MVYHIKREEWYIIEKNEDGTLEKNIFKQLREENLPKKIEINVQPSNTMKTKTRNNFKETETGN